MPEELAEPPPTTMDPLPTAGRVILVQLDQVDARPIAVYQWPRSVEADRPAEARAVILSRFLGRYPEKEQWKWRAVIRDVEVLE